MKKSFSFLFILLISFYSLTGQDNRLIYKGVPVVNITLLDGNAETDINKDIKLNATMTVTNASGSAFAASELFSGNITIKGRGNFTWWLPKRPYNIVTCDATFKKKNVNLLGFPSESSWCLLAEYEDRTKLRTVFTSALSYAIGLPWCSRGTKVEVYINNEYRGLYTLCEKVERGVNRVNIADLKTTDTSGNAVTGGYVLEQQTFDQIGPIDVYFKDAFSKYLSYKLPDADKITDQQNQYMANYWNSFLFKIYNVPRSDTVNGYRSVINPVSFAQYFLLEDISKNGDAYRNSWYMTKDRLKRMEAGPGWDWGITWGALNEVRNDAGMSNPFDTYVPKICLWYKDMLYGDPYFANLVKTTFANARAGINQVITDLENYYPRLVASGAIGRDAARWPSILTDASFWNYASTYQGDIDILLSFAKQRIYYQERSIYGLTPAKPIHTDLP